MGFKFWGNKHVWANPDRLLAFSCAFSLSSSPPSMGASTENVVKKSKKIGVDSGGYVSVRRILQGKFQEDQQGWKSDSCRPNRIRSMEEHVNGGRNFH